MFVSSRTRYGVALLAGALFPLAFAPLNLWPLAILCPAALLWTWHDFLVTPKEAFGLGYCFGLGMFGVGVSWVFVSIHQFGGASVFSAVLITSILIFFLALFIAIQGFALKYLFKGDTLYFWLMGFPCSWVIFEWIRSWMFTGFPWLYLGYSQLDTPLRSYAPIASVYAVSVVVAITSGAIITLLQGRPKQKFIALTVVGIIWGTGFLLKTHEYTQLYPKVFTTSLVQGNILPFDKFTQDDPIQSTEQSYGMLSQFQWGMDLILWPESAIPLPLPYSKDYIEQLRNMAWQHQSTLITGTQEIADNGQQYNSMIALGLGYGTYHKFHLLPFGDYVPLGNIFRNFGQFFNLPMSSFDNGPKEQALLSVGTLKVDPLICYEIAFPELVRNTLRNADLIVNLSEDGWFGGSWGPHQHLQIAQMRALETGRYLLRATTSGITAIIDPQGYVVSTLPQFEAGVLRGTFQSAKGNTPWGDTGIWPILILLFACFFIPGRGSIVYRMAS